MLEIDQNVPRFDAFQKYSSGSKILRSQFFRGRAELIMDARLGNLIEVFLLVHFQDNFVHSSLRTALHPNSHQFA